MIKQICIGLVWISVIKTIIGTFKRQLSDKNKLLLVLGLEELDNFDVLTGVDVGSAEGGEEDELVLPIILGVVQNIVNSDLKQNTLEALSTMFGLLPFC